MFIFRLYRKMLLVYQTQYDNYKQPRSYHISPRRILEAIEMIVKLSNASETIKNTSYTSGTIVKAPRTGSA